MENDAWLISTGVDYLRVTAKAGQDANYLENFGFEEVSREAKKDGIPASACKLGYDGVSINHIFVGRRADSTMLQISSHVDERILTSLDFNRVKCTRIDVQFLVRTNGYDGDYGHRRMIEAEEYRANAEEKENWAHITKIDGRGKGDTIRVGSRESEAFGRLYDKHMESRDDNYAACWRFEVEYKGSKAPKAVELLRGKNWSRRAIYSLCAAQYARWGFSVNFGERDEIDVPVRDRSSADIERKLGWLKTQVKPTVLRLLDGGAGARVVDALFGEDVDGVIADWYNRW